LGKEIENKILTLDERRNSQELKFKSWLLYLLFEMYFAKVHFEGTRTWAYEVLAMLFGIDNFNHTVALSH
jgi:hypothetical protein